MKLPEGPLRPTWLRLVALAAFSFALTAYAWWPMFSQHPKALIGDGQVHQAHLEAGRVSIVRYHEFPLWNPYECGGLPLWDNPQSLTGSPLVWPSLFIGSTRTLEIWIWFHVAFGFFGMWLLARDDLKLSRMAALVASGAWAFCGFHQHHYSGGHLTFAAYAYFPLALYMWRRAENNVRHAIGTGALVSWMFYEGSGYPIPEIILLLAVESLMRIRPWPRVIKIAKAAGIVGLVSFTLSASRLLPVLDQLRSHTRPIDPDIDALQWKTLVDMFLARSHGRAVPGQQYVWTEFGSYIGPIVLTLAAIGILLGGLEYAWLVVVLIASGALLAGHQGKYAPWHVLHQYVPPFKEMRVPGRFRSFVLTCLAAFAGVAVDRLQRLRWLSGERLRAAWGAAVIGIALLGVGDIISVGLNVIEPFFNGAPQGRPVPSTHLYYGGRDMAAYMDLPQQNRGRFECWDEWGFGTGAPLWEGDVPQARAIDDGAVVEVGNRTQNKFMIDVVATRPSRILLNTSYDKGWRTNVGTTAEQSKQLAIDIPVGRHQLLVQYWPWGLTAGIVITLAGFVGTIGFVVWDAKRRRARTRA
jgi:hypothetical protein